MTNLNLISLILNHFLNEKIHCILVFHCWSEETLNHFSRLGSHHSIYSQFADLNNSTALINFEHRYMRYDRPQIGVFMDFNCNQTEFLVDECSYQRLFNWRNNWLIFDEFANYTRFHEIFKNVNLSVDTKLAYVAPKKNYASKQTTFIACDVYNNGRMRGGTLNITTSYKIECNATECHNRTFLTNLHKRSFYGNRQSLRDVTLRVAVVVSRFDVKAEQQDIMDFLLKEKDFHIDSIAKFGMQIFMIIKDCLYTKVSYTFYDSWTKKEITGGIVGALVDETADLASSPLFHTLVRFQYLTPVAQTTSSRSVCMFRTPHNSGIHGRVFLDPFSTKVWILFAVLLLLSAVLLWFIFWVEFQQMQHFLEFVPSLLTTCLISFGSACAQGSYLVPRSLAGRLAFITVTLVCFIMYNYYTSVVVSSLLGSPVKSKIKTLTDLADSNLDIGLEPLPYTHTYLNFSTLPVVRHFVKRKIEGKKNLWYSNQEGIDKMRLKPGFVFIFEAQGGYFIIENQYDAHEICDLNEIPFRSDTLLSVHLHKNSSYKEITRVKIIRILETGVFSKHRRLWLPSRLNCLSSNIVLSVGMEYTAPLFLMLLFSYLFVLIIFVLEIISFRVANNMFGKATARE